MRTERLKASSRSLTRVVKDLASAFTRTLSKSFLTTIELTIDVHVFHDAEVEISDTV